MAHAPLQSSEPSKKRSRSELFDVDAPARFYLDCPGGASSQLHREYMLFRVLQVITTHLSQTEYEAEVSREGDAVARHGVVPDWTTRPMTQAVWRELDRLLEIHLVQPVPHLPDSATFPEPELREVLAGLALDRGSKFIAFDGHGLSVRSRMGRQRFMDEVVLCIGVLGLHGDADCRPVAVCLGREQRLSLARCLDYLFNAVRPKFTPDDFVFVIVDGKALHMFFGIDVSGTRKCMHCNRTIEELRRPTGREPDFIRTRAQCPSHTWPVVPAAASASSGGGGSGHLVATGAGDGGGGGGGGGGRGARGAAAGGCGGPTSAAASASGGGGGSGRPVATGAGGGGAGGGAGGAGGDNGGGGGGGGRGGGGTVSASANAASASSGGGRSSHPVAIGPRRGVFASVDPDLRTRYSASQLRMLACVPELGHTVGHNLRRLCGPQWSAIKRRLEEGSQAGPWAIALGDSVSIMGIQYVRSALSVSNLPKPACDLITQTLDVWDKGTSATCDEWDAAAEGIQLYMCSQPQLRKHYKRAVHRLVHIIEAARVFRLPVYSFLGQVTERMNQVMGRALYATRGDLRKAFARVRLFFRLRAKGLIGPDGMSTLKCPRYK